MDPDQRPRVFIGHVTMTVADPAASHDFYESIGTRSIHRSDDMAIIELRGGTHLLLFKGETEPGDAPFDLMVDDLEATREDWSTLGADVSDIIPGGIHSVCVLTDPDGHRIVVSDTHVEGAV